MPNLYQGRHGICTVSSVCVLLEAVFYGAIMSDGRGRFQVQASWRKPVSADDQNVGVANDCASAEHISILCVLTLGIGE